MMGRFDGKVVVVTGGARNTGLEIVDSFLREGAKVFFCGSIEASVAEGVKEAVLVTRDQSDLISEGGRIIRVVPAWKWLCGNSGGCFRAGGETGAL